MLGAEAITLKQLAASLLAWIGLSTGLPMPQDTPEIRFVSHEGLESLASCQGNCPVLGFYSHRQVIYLDQAMSRKMDLCAISILVHELTHYVQDINGRFADKSPYMQWNLREAEAHRVQRAYIEQYSPRYRPLRRSSRQVVVNMDRDHSERGNNIAQAQFAMTC